MTKTETAEISVPMLVRARPATRSHTTPTAEQRAAACFEAIRASTPNPSSEAHELTEQQALQRLSGNQHA